MRERLTYEKEILDLGLEAEVPLPLPIKPAKEPLAVPPSEDKFAALLKRCKWHIVPSDSVPFADPPPKGSYWPLITSYPRKVAYVASDGDCVGVSQKGRQFLADRSGNRYHVGVDLFANLGDPVVACEDGRIVNFYCFLYNKKTKSEDCKPHTKGNATYALLVEHPIENPRVVINYGEVAKDSLVRTGLKIGDEIKAGQIIGYIGRNPGGSSMLHFETYRKGKGTARNYQWLKNEKKPPQLLLNPTKYLVFLQDYGRIGTGIGKQPIPSIPRSSQDIFSLPQQLQDAVRKGLLTMEIAFAILFGERDVNKLTNLVFYARYPDMLNKKLKRDDPRAQEWVHIRDNVIRPVLEKISSLGSVPVAPRIPSGTDISLTKNKEQILTDLRAFTAPSEKISISDALNVMKLICQYHNIPWRLGYTILVHEGGIKLFRHKINKDGVMQTIESARKDTIPRIPRDLKLTLLGRTMSDTISDKDLDNLIHTGFPDRLAVQIATGVQELKTNLERFKGYIALAFAAYNTGSGNASLVVTKGKSKKRPGRISDDEWEAMCRSAASLLHQPPINVRVGQGNWLCDPNLRTGKWIPRYGSKVYDKKSGIQLIGYQYLRSVRGYVPSQGPNSRCDWNIPQKQRKQPGSGKLVYKTTRDGVLDKLYNPVKLGAYYKAAENELHPIPDDNLPVKVLNGRLVKVKDSGDLTEVAL